MVSVVQGWPCFAFKPGLRIPRHHGFRCGWALEKLSAQVKAVCVDSRTSGLGQTDRSLSLSLRSGWSALRCSKQTRSRSGRPAYPAAGPGPFEASETRRCNP